MDRDRDYKERYYTLMAPIHPADEDCQHGWQDLTLEERAESAKNVIGLPVTLTHEGDVCGKIVKSFINCDGVWWAKIELDENDMGKQASDGFKNKQFNAVSIRTAYQKKTARPQTKNDRFIAGHEHLALVYEGRRKNTDIVIAFGKDKKDEKTSNISVSPIQYQTKQPYSMSTNDNTQKTEEKTPQESKDSMNTESASGEKTLDPLEALAAVDSATLDEKAKLGFAALMSIQKDRDEEIAQLKKQLQEIQPVANEAEQRKRKERDESLEFLVEDFKRRKTEVNGEVTEEELTKKREQWEQMAETLPEQFGDMLEMARFSRQEVQKRMQQEKEAKESQAQQAQQADPFKDQLNSFLQSLRNTNSSVSAKPSFDSSSSSSSSSSSVGQQSFSHSNFSNENRPDAMSLSRGITVSSFGKGYEHLDNQYEPNASFSMADWFQSRGGDPLKRFKTLRNKDTVKFEVINNIKAGTSPYANNL